MLRDQSIVCFAPDPWDDLWRNRHRLLSIFARENRVLYVEPRTLLRGLVRQIRARRVGRRHFLRRRVEEARPNLFVYHDPMHLPRVSRPYVGAAVDRLRTRLFRRTLGRLGLREPILWLVRPDCWDVPGSLGEKMVLYQVVDDYLTYPGLTDRARERVDAEERRLAAKADLVIVTSEHLLETKRHLSHNMVLVRNAVDERTLEEGRAVAGAVPSDLASLPRPIFGYIGGITEKLDFDLLQKVAQKLRGSTGGSLVFVGSINVQGKAAVEKLERLHSSPGVFFTGRRDPQRVPSYIRAFDVCLIPYRVGDQARAIDPLKLYEYLAFGKPTVSVEIASVQRFADVVRVAGDHDGFLSHLDAAAADDDPAAAERRRALAGENSWENRAEQISGAIETTLERKATGPRAR